MYSHRTTRFLRVTTSGIMRLRIYFKAYQEIIQPFETVILSLQRAGRKQMWYYRMAPLLTFHHLNFVHKLEHVVINRLQLWNHHKSIDWQHHRPTNISWVVFLDICRGNCTRQGKHIFMFGVSNAQPSTTTFIRIWGHPWRKHAYQIWIDWFTCFRTSGGQICNIWIVNKALQPEQ